MAVRTTPAAATTAARILDAWVSAAKSDPQSRVEALSLRAVARAAGVSQTAPYRHFENRRALVAGVAEDGFARLGSAVTVWSMIDVLRHSTVCPAVMVRFSGMNLRVFFISTTASTVGGEAGAAGGVGAAWLVARAWAEA